MSNLGIGVMIGFLGGNDETVKVMEQCLNKKISKVEMIDEELRIRFTDKTVLRLYDDGQSCCESRYMRTDDDLKSFRYAKFLGAEIKEAPEVKTEWDVHEVQFLEIKTSKGSFVMSSHNEHNGYYGGFLIVARML